MESLTVDEDHFSMKHFEQCPIWGVYTEDYSNEVLVAVNSESAAKCATGPFYIAADFVFSGGIKCEGFVIIGPMDFDVYAVVIWTGEQFCTFNKHMGQASFVRKLATTTADTGTSLALEEMFPIRYEMRIPKDLIDDSRFNVAGTFELPDK